MPCVSDDCARDLVLIIQAKQAIKHDQQEREAAWNKANMQEQLLHKVKYLPPSLPPLGMLHVAQQTLSHVMSAHKINLCLCPPLQAHMREALEDMNKEQNRRVVELSKLSLEEIEQRVQISDKLLEVQKELLAKHTALKVCRLLAPITGTPC